MRLTSNLPMRCGFLLVVLIVSAGFGALAHTPPPPPVTCGSKPSGCMDTGNSICRSGQYNHPYNRNAAGLWCISRFAHCGPCAAIHYRVPDPANGGIYALTKDDIANNTLPPAIDVGLGALDGLDFTAQGVMLNTQIRDDKPQAITVDCLNAYATLLALEPGGTIADLNGPADLAVRRKPGDAQLAIVPELFPRDATAGDDEVTVLALPPDFDAACGIWPELRAARWFTAKR